MTTRTVLLLLLMVTAVHAQTYRWEDAGGGINFSDNYNDIPLRYRNQARIVADPQSYNVMPSSSSENKAGSKTQNSSITAATMANNTTSTRKPRRKSTGRPVKQRRHQHQVETPTTPARQAQDRIEEQLRRDRQKLDDSSRPARQTIEKNEEQIRRNRDSISGH